MAAQPPEDVVTVAHALMKLEYWAEFDAEALLNAIREKYGSTKEELSAPELKEIFMGLNYDKIKVEEEEENQDQEGGDAAEEEGGEGEGEGEGEGGDQPAKPPKPEPKKEITKNAETTFDLLNPEHAPALPLRHILSTLNLCKNGFGEPALRFTIKVLDADGKGSLKEPQLWYALTQCANQPLDAVARNHLRRAWRAAEKEPLPGENGEEGEGGEGGEGDEGAEEASAPAPAPAPPAEEENGEEKNEDEGEGEEGKEADGEQPPQAPAPAPAPAPPPKPKFGPEDVRVIVDDFIAKMTEDERLASIILKEIAIPEPPKSADENLPPAEDD